MRKIIYTLLLLANVIVVGLIVKSMSTDISKNDNMYLIPNCEKVGRYTMIADNIINCDLTTFSFIIQQMEKDGYRIEGASYEKALIDMTLSKDSEMYRIVYTSAGDCTSISSNYEKSYIPFTYINEG